MDALDLIHTFGMHAINAKDRRISELEQIVEAMQSSPQPCRFINLSTGEAVFLPPEGENWCTVAEAVHSVRQCRVRNAEAIQEEMRRRIRE